MLLTTSVLVIVFTSIVIMYACNAFEDAADYLGRNMKPGVKGATINAIGSSLPELFTTAILLFGPLWSESMFGQRGAGFAAGIATCAGSAVFNSVIIPGLSVLAVLVWGVKHKDGSREKIKLVVLDKRLIFKDGFFLILSELALIYFLGWSIMSWWMGAVFAGMYVVYAFITLKFGFASDDEEDEEGEEEEEEAEEAEEARGRGLLGLGWLLDFKARFYGNEAFDTKRAWIVLGAAVVVIGIACGGIAWAVEQSAHALGIPSYFTAVILAAAATSVPDTVLSVKDAFKGEYDDAVANAVGSNIFDICISLGLPLMLYGLFVGDVDMSIMGSADDVQILRWILLAVTGAVLALFLFGRGLARGKMILLFILYIGWTVFVVGRGFNASWTHFALSVGLPFVVMGYLVGVMTSAWAQFDTNVAQVTGPIEPPPVGPDNS